jgi:hypothetical protein
MAHRLMTKLANSTRMILWPWTDNLNVFPTSGLLHE